MEAKAVQWEFSNFGKLYSIGIGIGPWLTVGVSFAYRGGALVIECLCFAVQIDFYDE